MSLPRPWVVATSQWIRNQPVEVTQKWCRGGKERWLQLDLEVMAPEPEQPVAGNVGDRAKATPQGRWLRTTPEDTDVNQLLAGTECPVWLRVHNNTPGVVEVVRDWIPTHLSRRTWLVESPVDVVHRALREGRGEDLFGASSRELTRLLLLSGFGIEPAAEIYGDVITLPAWRGRTWVLDETARAEVARRKKMVCVGPLRGTDSAKWKELRPTGFDCVLTDDPTQFLGGY